MGACLVCGKNIKYNAEHINGKVIYMRHFRGIIMSHGVSKLRGVFELLKTVIICLAEFHNGHKCHLRFGFYTL